MTKENFLHHPVKDFFTFGLPPVAFDLMIKLEGFDFQEVYNRAVNLNEDELDIKIIHKNDLIGLLNNKQVGKKFK